MNDATLKKIHAELEKVLTGRKFGKIFVLSKLQIAVDFRLDASLYLFISLEPNAPRVYLIEQRLKELEKRSGNPPPFLLFLRKRLSNATLRAIEKIAGERILKLDFSAFSEIGQTENYSLIVQLTGRSANLFLLDENGFILDSLRENSGEGQEIADLYAPPKRPENKTANFTDDEVFPQDDFSTLSKALDIFYQKLETEKLFQAKAKSAEAKIRQEIKKRETLVGKMLQDLEKHGDAERWKRFGDLILANLANAEIRGGSVFVTDFYDENIPQIEIGIEENLSLSENAERFFKRYTKARNAKEEISKRLEILNAELVDLRLEKEAIENAITENDLEFLNDFLGVKEENFKKSKKKPPSTASKTRNFTSSDGFEILVGKGAKDNDFLTFRVAKSNDLWLHAADYPGSHVVVKSRNRQEIPHKTLLEAAQLAAFYSNARSESKAAVHYTLKKFVHKPKGAVAGLVNLASFKTILVEPKVIEK